MTRLKAGKRLEISTGLYLDQDPTPGTHNGQRYQSVARRLTPDHLAVLDSVGACSVRDGCGLNVNHYSAREVIDALNSYATRHERRTKMDEPLGILQPDWEAYSDLRPATPPISRDAPEGGLGLPAID